jgi:Zn-dependent peptidase ImmA (M78 family)
VAAGLSRAQVAATLAVRRADVTRIEHGRRTVSGVELEKLARLYHKPSARCLIEPAGAPPIRDLRSDYRLDERDLIVIEEVGDWLAYYAWLERSALGAQRYQFPTYPLPGGDPIEQGERLAGEERSRLGLGEGDAIPSMVALLEREGVKVTVQAFHPKSRAFGCFLFSEALGPCAVVNRDRTPAERRLAAAHAYAHLLVDEQDVSGEVCGPFRAHELDELRAGSFATNFLLPAGGVAGRLEDLGVPGEVTFERVVNLGHDFGASYPAVVARLADLGWVDDRRRSRLERRARAGPSGTDGEPGDTEPEPVRFRSVAVEAWRCGRISTGKLADLLDLPEADVALLLGHPASST